MDHFRQNGLLVAGIAVRTTNSNGKAMKDIPQLWNTFMVNDIKSKIPSKVDETIYALYTDYEGDHTQPYTIVIGYAVQSSANIPEDLTVKSVPANKYVKFTAKGDLTKMAVYECWEKIWKTDLKRTFTTDIEVYGEKATNPTDGEAEIWIAIES